MLVVVDASTVRSAALDGIESLQCWIPDISWTLWNASAPATQVDEGRNGAWKSVQHDSENGASMIPAASGSSDIFVCTKHTSTDLSAVESSGYSLLCLDKSCSAAQARAAFVSCFVKAVSKSGVKPRIVATLMKAAREKDLCARGLLHMMVRDGLMYVPWEAGLDLEHQIQPDVVLLKATDFIEDVIVDDDSVPFSLSIQKVDTYARAQNIPVIDALKSVALIADRRATRDALEGFEAATGGMVQLSTSVTVTTKECWNKLDLSDQLGGNALLIKPAAACGLASSHEMAIVTDPIALTDLKVQLPAVVEGFVNHGGVQFKCYVLGDQVYCHVKASIPDVGSMTDGSTLELGPSVYPCDPAYVYRFHSLDSMPKASSEALVDAQEPSLSVLHACRDAIRSKLGLTIFGFDLIRPLKAGRVPFVMIDVNAFPSFKGIDSAGDDLRTFLAGLGLK